MQMMLLAPSSINSSISAVSSKPSPDWLHKERRGFTLSASSWIVLGGENLLFSSAFSHIVPEFLNQPNAKPAQHALYNLRQQNIQSIEDVLYVEWNQTEGLFFEKIIVGENCVLDQTYLRERSSHYISPVFTQILLHIPMRRLLLSRNYEAN